MAFQRPAIVSERVTQRRRRKHTVILVGVLVTLGLLLGGAIWISRMDAFQIQNIEVLGASNTLEKEIETLASAETEGYLGWIFPRKNIFLFSKEETKKKIVEQYLKVKTITIKRIGLSKILITIEERKPYALWCSAGAEETGECYFSDTEGYIFASAPFFSDHTYFQLYGDPLILPDEASSTVLVQEEPQKGPLGKQYLPPDVFTKAMIFVQTLEQNSMKTYSLTIHDMDLFELTLAQGGVIRFSPKQDTQKTISDLKVAYEKKFSEQKEVTPAMLEYIDVRFANKVVFKFVDKSEE